MTSSNLRNSRRLGIILGCRSQAISMLIDQGVDGRKLVMITKHDSFPWRLPSTVDQSNCWAIFLRLSHQALYSHRLQSHFILLNTPKISPFTFSSTEIYSIGKIADLAVLMMSQLAGHGDNDMCTMMLVLLTLVITGLSPTSSSPQDK